MNDATVPLVALSLVPGLGATRIHELLRRFGSPAAVLEASGRELGAAGLSRDARAYVRTGCALRTAERAVVSLGKRGVGLLTLFDPQYPQLLREIYDPPVVLYYLGAARLLSGPAVAMVGARRCSVYGRQVTRSLAEELTRLGLTVVSGMARGIDSHAHWGALEGGGKTVAVLGSGVDVVYPRENKKLYERLVSEGCVISEFPCGSFPAPQNFPVRNRVISGLSLGTIITEAAEFSGSLITARLALEQNRLVWAVPGNVTNEKSYGPNLLIRQGASLLYAADQLLEDLPPYVLERLRRDEPPSGEAGTCSAEKEGTGRTTPEEERILRFLSPDRPEHVDHLIEVSGVDPRALSLILFDLEVKKLVRRLPGNRFHKCVEPFGRGGGFQ